MTRAPRARSARSRGEIARAALRRQHRVLLTAIAVLGFLYVSLGALDGSLVTPVAMGASIIAALVFVRRIALLGTRIYGGMASVSAAVGEMEAGRPESAEAMLSAVPADSARQPYVRRAIELHRARIAMHRGDAEEALRFATLAAAPVTSFWTRAYEQIEVVEAHAWKGLALASLGRRDEALAAAATAASSPFLGPGALARVSLARAVCLAREGRLEELHAHYAAEGEMLVEELTSRERSLSRALRRMGQPRVRSVYREPAPRDESDDQDARAWVRHIAPEAARFLPAVTRAPSLDVAAAAKAASGATASASPAVAATRDGGVTLAALVRRGAARARSAANALRAAAFALCLCALLYAVSQLFQPTSAPASAVSHASLNGSSIATLVVSIIVVFALTWFRVARAGRATRTLQQAQLRLARGDAGNEGDVSSAERDLVRLARGGVMVGATQACLALARLYIRRGDASAALAICERGMAVGSSSATGRAAYGDLLLPELLSLHAFALTMMKRTDEAEAELGLLDREYPGFALRAQAAHRIELLSALNRGDLALAAHLVASRAPETNVDLRVELLGEVVCAAAAGGLHDEAAEALQGELAALPAVARWIEQVAPGLTARIARGHAVRVDTRAPAHVEDELADGTAATMEATETAANRLRA